MMYPLLTPSWKYVWLLDSLACICTNPRPKHSISLNSGNSFTFSCTVRSNLHCLIHLILRRESWWANEKVMTFLNEELILSTLNPLFFSHSAVSLEKKFRLISLVHTCVSLCFGAPTRWVVLRNDVLLFFCIALRILKFRRLPKRIAFHQ